MRPVGRDKKTCLQCFKTFEIRPKAAEKGRGKFCSLKCWGEFQGGITTSVKPSQTYNRWTVIEEGPNTPQGLRRWRCRCQCGSEQLVAQTNLVKGQPASCGCLQSEVTTARNYKHGLVGTSEYRSWSAMKQRCSDPLQHEWHRYGGRGITVCAEWREDFEAFLAHVGLRPSPEHSIDRIDNDKGYEPGNVRWATRIEQRRNSSQIHILTARGESKSMIEWSESVGIRYGTLCTRIRKGWNTETAIFSPTRPQSPRSKSS